MNLTTITVLLPIKVQAWWDNTLPKMNIPSSRWNFVTPTNFYFLIYFIRSRYGKPTTLSMLNIFNIYQMKKKRMDWLTICNYLQCPHFFYNSIIRGERIWILNTSSSEVLAGKVGLIFYFILSSHFHLYWKLQPSLFIYWVRIGKDKV